MRRHTTVKQLDRAEGRRNKCVECQAALLANWLHEQEQTSSKEERMAQGGARAHESQQPPFPHTNPDVSCAKLNVGKVNVDFRCQTPNTSTKRSPSTLTTVTTLTPQNWPSSKGHFT